MAEVININSKRQKQEDNSSSIKNEIIQGLNNLDISDISGGIVLLMRENGEAISGYFNTSFRDEATLAKILDIDIIYRQQSREGDTNE